MRQRMVSDGVWEDPDLSHLTSENKLTLLLLLTNSHSNIIGIYRVVWRVLGAGLGWTHEQTLQAVLDLQDKGVVQIDAETGWLWVKVWWKNNSIRGALTGNVAKKALSEIKQVPEIWRENILKWFSDNDEEGACKGLISGLQGAGANPIPNPNINPTAADVGRVEGEDLEDLISATLRARQHADPPQNPAGWKKWARRQAGKGDFSHLEQGRQLLVEEKRRKEADARLEERRAARPDDFKEIDLASLPAAQRKTIQRARKGGNLETFS